MKIVFNFKHGDLKTSPDFPAPDAETLEEFWDEYLGSEAEDGEIFWNSDISDDDDDIIVDWFIDPVNHQRVVDALAKGLQVAVPPYVLWK